MSASAGTTRSEVVSPVRSSGIPTAARSSSGTDHSRVIAPTEGVPLPSTSRFPTTTSGPPSMSGKRTRRPVSRSRRDRPCPALKESPKRSDQPMGWPSSGPSPSSSTFSSGTVSSAAAVSSAESSAVSSAVVEGVGMEVDGVPASSATSDGGGSPVSQPAHPPDPEGRHRHHGDGPDQPPPDRSVTVHGPDGGDDRCVPRHRWQPAAGRRADIRRRDHRPVQADRGAARPAEPGALPSRCPAGGAGGHGSRLATNTRPEVSRSERRRTTHRSCSAS